MQHDNRPGQACVAVVTGSSLQLLAYMTAGAQTVTQLRVELRPAAKGYSKRAGGTGTVTAVRNDENVTDAGNSHDAVSSNFQYW